jgi:hypothetical protein
MSPADTSTGDRVRFEGDRMRLAIVGAVVVGATVLGACGRGEVDVRSQRSDQMSAPPVEQVSLQAPEFCSIDYRTLVTASEAYWAMNMTYPQNQDELLTAGLLRTAIDVFELTAVGTSYSLVGVHDCAAFEPDESSFDPAPDEASAAESTSVSAV